MRLLLVLLGCCSLYAAEDLIIRNVRVVDGTGNPWYTADVAIRDGHISRIGQLGKLAAQRVVDGGGKVLAPGFIDVHTHIESGINAHPAAENFLRDGVTTVVTGNCGSSTLDPAAFFSKLEKSGVGINVATFIGHNSVRGEVMGASQRQANGAELAKMQAIVDRAMKAGAVGLSTGLEYVPGTYAPASEIAALAKVTAKYGGVYASHMRDEGEKVEEAMKEAIDIGRQAGVPVEISHLKQDTKRYWGASTKMLALLDEARRDGVDVTADVYPYTAFSTTLRLTLPSWAFADGQEAMRKRFADPATRAKIVRETVEDAKGRGEDGFGYAVVANCSFDPSLEGKSISEIHRAKGGKPGLAAEAETIVDLLNRGNVSVVSHCMSEDDVTRILKHPYLSVASDGGVVTFGSGRPHPRNYGTNARVLARYVREQNALTLEDAVRKMTSLPARRFSLAGRGEIREGNWADLVLFDPATVTDEATFEEPHKYSKGFTMVLVNGVVEVENGRVTTSRAGKPLRHE